MPIVFLIAYWLKMSTVARASGFWIVKLLISYIIDFLQKLIFFIFKIT
jgi:hypothetical protein